MKTSYCLVAAAGLTAAAVTIYDRLPLRAESPPATLPMPHDPVALAPATLPALPAVPDVPLPPIVPPPDGPLVIPAAGAPAPALPALLPLPPTPALPSAPVTPLPVPPVTAQRPAPAVVPPATTPALPVVPSIPSVPLTTPNPTGPQVAPAPAPIVPAAPQEPKPLPLPTPTPFTPGLDSLKPEPTANIAPAGKLVVVKGNKLIEGSVRTDGDKVIVRQGSFDRTFAKLDVLYVAESRDEAYRFMLAKVPADNADSRLTVAKWCALNGLREQALTEAREILKLKPGHRGATELARSVDESLRQFPPDGATSPKPQGALVAVVEPEPDVTAEGATSFASKAQPILANQCIECHARDDHTSAFRLKRVTGFEVGPQSTHANLLAVAGQLKKDDPVNSPLLVKALTAHGGMKQPAFVSRQAVAFRLLESWVVVAVGNAPLPTMTPPAQPVIPSGATVSPIPPSLAAPQPTTTPASPTATKPVLPPVDPAPSNVPAVLPTPPSIPAAEAGTRTTPPKLPAIPGIPSAASLPKSPSEVKPAGQFGTWTKPPAPPGIDEFDAAGFNRTLTPGK